MKGRAAGKIALVTGAGSGIGRAMAVALAAHDAAITCADLNLAGDTETTAAITASGSFSWASQLDGPTELAWQDLLEQILFIRLKGAYDWTLTVWHTAA